MNETDQAIEEEEWVKVGYYPSLEQAYDHGLVILAMGEACRVEATEVPGEFELHAEAMPAPKITAELDVYENEIESLVKQPFAAREWVRHSTGWWLTGIWMMVLIAVFYWQNQDASLIDRAASSNLGLISRGEWWRPFTALFLHGDLGHLLGNLMGGLVFASLVARLIGPVRGWALILACGAFGNAITSRLTYPEPFVSLGASTAVFAALGIISGLGLAETLRDRARLQWVRITAPIFGGIILLGWLGGGHDPHTDVLGHVFGFGSGLAAGVVTGVIEEKRASVTA
jgi:membrane associated rhomboid family serine protease